MSNEGVCLKEKFNGLSKADRAKLKSAALLKAMTGFIKDDTERSPWKYPFYATYLLFVVTPMPGGVLLLAATGLWMRFSKSKMALETGERIKTAFNECNLIRDHEKFVESDPKLQGHFRVRNNMALVVDTTKKALRDSVETTRHAWRSLKKVFS